MMNAKNTILLLALFFLPLAMLSAQSPVGVWKTIDDNTKEARSHVEIYEQGGKLYGKIIKLLDEDPSSLCEKCKGPKKNKPLIGLVIIEDLKTKKDYWAKGTILDPENGKEYGCSIWFEKDNNTQLKVRGKHWTGLYRTQTWYRVN